ncbi:DNA-dependent protein kinase catalytic subunit [Bienertia sinuspersici]
MKRNSTKAAAQKRELTEYEKKRLETMRKNLECMKAKGCGTLAQKIFQANSEMFPETARDEGFGNDDEEYIPDYEVGDNEDVASLKAPITKSTLKGPSSKRRCMSDFLAKQQQQAEPRKQHQKVDQQHQSLPYHKSYKLLGVSSLLISSSESVSITKRYTTSLEFIQCLRIKLHVSV